MTTQPLLTPHQSQYFAWLLTRRAAGDSVESLAATLVDAQVDLNPHQVDAALFACRNPLARGVLLADEVGLGKTIEAGLVISQRWAERRRRILIVVPANLRKQWHQELQDKFGLHGLILEAKSYNAIRKQEQRNPFLFASGPIICSYQFAKAKADDVKGIDWDLVVLDEAHRLRNVYKPGNVIARTLRDALAPVHAKVLLTATPLQNSLLELYGLVSFIDDRVFGDLDSFRSQFTGREQSFSGLRDRLAPICKRTLRKQVQPYVSYTARRAIVEEFTPSSEEQELSRLVADYLRRPNLKALPEGQRQLISLVLWKLLASSTHAIAGALETMAERLQGVLDQAPVVPDLAEALDEDYESLDETADEWNDQDADIAAPSRTERDAIAQEIEELRHFKQLATNIRDNAKGKALLTALDRAFAELERLGAAKKAIIFTESRRTQDYLLSLLADTPYGDGIVLFNGTNSDAHAQAVYKGWLKRHAGTDRAGRGAEGQDRPQHGADAGRPAEGEGHADQQRAEPAADAEIAVEAEVPLEQREGREAHHVQAEEDVHVVHHPGFHHRPGPPNPLLRRLEDEFHPPRKPGIQPGDYFRQTQPDGGVAVVAAGVHGFVMAGGEIFPGGEMIRVQGFPHGNRVDVEAKTDGRSGPLSQLPRHPGEALPHGFGVLPVRPLPYRPVVLPAHGVRLGKPHPGFSVQHSLAGFHPVSQFLEPSGDKRRGPVFPPSKLRVGVEIPAVPHRVLFRQGQELSQPFSHRRPLS